jgi:hypothetical protein
MDLVVNEWLPEYFRPTATLEEKRMLQFFLNKFLIKKDVLYVRRPSEFLKKLHLFAKNYQTDTKAYENIKKFINVVLIDSEKTIFVDEMYYSLPQSTIEKLSVGNYSSDTYLFEAAIHTKSKIILTTDEKLAIQMKDDEIFKVLLLKDFLKNY